MRIEPENLTDVELLGYLKPGAVFIPLTSVVSQSCVVERALLVELIKRYQQASKALVEAIEERDYWA